MTIRQDPAASAKKKPTKKPEPMQPIYIAIGTKMVMIRASLGLTQQELAARIGLERASVANIETGRQRILLHDIENIATALGTTPKHLLRGIWL